MDVVWLFVKPQSAHRCSKALPQAGTHTLTKLHEGFTISLQCYT